MSKYSFDEIKEKFSGQFVIDFEPELTLHINSKEYMIIFYDNRCSFQRCGYPDGSGEVYFDTLDDLYNAETIDGILLKRDWDDITDFECWEFGVYFNQNF